MEGEFPLLLSANFLGVTPLQLPNLTNTVEEGAE